MTTQSERYGLPLDNEFDNEFDNAKSSNVSRCDNSLETHCTCDDDLGDKLLQNKSSANCLDSSQFDETIMGKATDAQGKLESLVNEEIVNLSSHKLTSSQKNVLKYGLNFCPTPGIPDRGEILKELNDFNKRVSVKCHFLNNPSKSTLPMGNIRSDGPYKDLDSVSKVKKPSGWTPRHTPPNLDFMFQLNEHKINNEKLSKPRVSNLKKKEYKSLIELSKMNEIIINKADKGGAVVIQNTTDYIKQSESELGDTRFYKKVDHDMTEEHASRINQELDRLVSEGEIDEKIATVLKVINPRTPQIYFLPKIHKGKLPPPGRPICSSNDGPTEKISAFLAIF